MFGSKPRILFGRRRAAAVVMITGALALAGTTGAVASGPVVVKAVHNPAHGNIVVDTNGMSLYLLTSEAHGQFTCNVVCTIFWPALTVPNGTTSVSAAKGVAGKLGLVKRPEGTTQVTYNGYPLYRYVQDSSPGQTQGQGVSSFGGTWYLVNPAATTAATTAVRH